MLAAGNCGRGDYYIGIDDNRNLEAVKILIKAGANLNVRDKEEGMTALMFALEGVVYEDGVEIAKALIKAGANVNIKDNEGKTALDYANQECEYRYEERAYGMNNENDLKLCEEIRNIIQDSMN